MAQKIGEGHFSAWMRQGLREIRAMFYPESNVAQPAEYGLYGTRHAGRGGGGPPRRPSRIQRGRPRLSDRGAIERG